jgi:MFS family permease
MHAAPMYIAETAPSQIRGMLISLKEFFIVLGMLVSVYYFFFITPSAIFRSSFLLVFLQLGYIAGNLYVEVVSGWRYMYVSSTPLCLIMGVGMCWLPSSPRWLLLCAIQGKGNLPDTKENATRCLCRLRGQASPDLVSEQIDLILEELSYIDQEKQASFGEIFQGKCLKAMIIGCGLVFFQQVILISLIWDIFLCLYYNGLFFSEK